MGYILVDNTGNKIDRRQTSKCYNYFFSLSLFPTVELQNFLRLVSMDATLFRMDVRLLRMAFCMCQYCHRSLGVCLCLCAAQRGMEEG